MEGHPSKVQLTSVITFDRWHSRSDAILAAWRVWPAEIDTFIYTHHFDIQIGGIMKYTSKYVKCHGLGWLKWHEWNRGKTANRCRFPKTLPNSEVFPKAPKNGTVESTTAHFSDIHDSSAARQSADSPAAKVKFASSAVQKYASQKAFAWASNMSAPLCAQKTQNYEGTPTTGLDDGKFWQETPKAHILMIKNHGLPVDCLLNQLRGGTWCVSWCFPGFQSGLEQAIGHFTTCISSLECIKD